MLPDGRLRDARTWAIAPGAEDVADEGRDRFDLAGFATPEFALTEGDGRLIVETGAVAADHRPRWLFLPLGDAAR